jgi:small subunit ribosomal protein S17
MNRRTYTGKIVSTKMQKTAVVEVNVPRKHKIYAKDLRFSKKFMARNPIDAKLGDYVTIEESKPFSKRCTWLIINKLEAKEAE